MPPQDRQEFEDMKKRLAALERVENVPFIENITRRLRDSFSIPRKLSDLNDVSGTDSASIGQVLKKTATTWQPGTDNTGP
jgi:ferritin-like protein